jgi:tetratricopeptide (TPR) repeat protein
VLATINTFYHWDWSEAEKYFRYALRINPNSSMIHTNYSVMLVFARRYEEAISESMRAQELDPLSAYINTRVGMAFFYSGNYEKAIAEYQAALTINAGYFFTHLNLGNTYLAKNMLREAAIEYRKAVDLSNGTPVAVACLLVASYQTGEDEKANKIFDEFKARSESEYIPASFFFMIYRMLGNEYQAIEWLKKAFAERDTFLLWIKDLPRWFPENSHYSALLKIAGL